MMLIQNLNLNHPKMKIKLCIHETKKHGKSEMKTTALHFEVESPFGP